MTRLEKILINCLERKKIIANFIKTMNHKITKRIDANNLEDFFIHFIRFRRLVLDYRLIVKEQIAIEKKIPNFADYSDQQWQQREKDLCDLNKNDYGSLEVEEDYIVLKFPLNK